MSRTPSYVAYQRVWEGAAAGSLIRAVLAQADLVCRLRVADGSELDEAVCALAVLLAVLETKENCVGDY